MVILGIDTSLKAASVCIYKDGEVLVDYLLNNERTHSEKLMEMVDEALKISKTDINDIDAFALACGPGSFTGLRIGAATVKGLAEPFSKKVYTASTLECLYESVRITDELPVLVMIDAGRDELYCALFDKGEYVIKDCCLNAEELFKKVNEKYESVLVTGDCVSKYKEKISEIIKKPRFADNAFACGRGAGVVKASLKYEPVEPDKVAPVYLKVSQAERMKQQKREN